MVESDGRIRTFPVVDETIPGAHWQILNILHNHGYPLRTEYDRKTADGSPVDPSSGRDGKFIIEIKNPFSQPRYPFFSFCEIGKYIAEILGVKDHLVPPYDELKAMAEGGEVTTLWPYTYHSRLASYPCRDGSVLNQLKVMTDKLAKSPLTRRAIAITGVPEIDLFLEEPPCLRYIQLRAIENRKGQLVLNMHTSWRSRAAYTAWHDNVMALTNLQAKLASDLNKKTEREIIVGPYTEANGSLHLYPQDYDDPDKDFAKKFVGDFPTRESYIAKARDTTSETMQVYIDSQLEQLAEESTWRFPSEALRLIEDLREGYRSGEFTP
ncbi:hypothetical protein GF386_06380 [Candidatus Pacearchaeota archaeon]|nr:hypothetical protein [Candidatus Pacearchaeota archaeon]MBD3283716.1 hypothetical protein [Candidatus Pacearchaeota archaeon]